MSKFMRAMHEVGVYAPITNTADCGGAGFCER